MCLSKHIQIHPKQKKYTIRDGAEVPVPAIITTADISAFVITMCKRGTRQRRKEGRKEGRYLKIKEEISYVLNKTKIEERISGFRNKRHVKDAREKERKAHREKLSNENGKVTK